MEFKKCTVYACAERKSKTNELLCIIIFYIWAIYIVYIILFSVFQELLIKVLLSLRESKTDTQI